VALERAPTSLMKHPGLDGSVGAGDDAPLP
jgi:hypothetical protein